MVHVQLCCFANQTYCFFWRSRYRPCRWILKSLITFNVQQPAIPEGPKRVRLSQLSTARKAIPKNCPRGTETIFHTVCIGRRKSEFAVGVSQKVRGDIATIASFLITVLDLYRKRPNKRPLSNKHLLSNKRPPPAYTVKLVLNAPCLLNAPLENCPQILGNGEIEGNQSIY